MNAKDIKAMRWHKQSMINVMRAEGIEVHEVDITLDNIIENLDEKRRSEDPIKKAQAKGYKAGHMDGRFSGYSEGWDNAKEKYEDHDSQDHDQHNPRIIITEGSFGGYSVYVDHEYIGHHTSRDVAVKMGDEYIAGRWDE